MGIWSFYRLTGWCVSVADRTHPTRIALLNAHSTANKAFILKDFLLKEHLDFMSLAETWQRKQEYTHLNELCPPGYSVFGTPRASQLGGRLVVIYQSHLCMGSNDSLN